MKKILSVFLCAVMLFSLVTVVVLLLNKYPVKKASRILVVNGTDENLSTQITAKIASFSKHYTVKSKSVSKGSISMVVEISVPDDSAVTSEILAIDGVISVSLLTHDGEVTAA